MKRNVLAFAVTAMTAIGLGSAAHAADIDWTGGYVGVDTSLNWAEQKAYVGGGTQTNNLDGPALGGFAGYNYQFDNNLVIGLEGELSYNWNEKKIYNGGWIPGTEKIATQWQGGIGARAGYAYENILFYGKAGWVSSEISNTYDGLGTTDVINGWSVGAGVDYAISEKFFARAQYDYIDFGKQKFLESVSSSFDQHPKTRMHQNRLMIGLGARF